MSRVVGHVDEVTSTAILGWIANLDEPGRLEPLLCWSAAGDSVVLYPFAPRPDVCKALSLAGRFGFAIPISTVRRLGPILRFTDCAGTPLRGGGAVQLPEQRQDVSRRHPVRIFIHIPKTAGTSLRTALASAFQPGEAVFLYPDGATGISPTELKALPLLQRSALQFVMGHVYFDTAKSVPRTTEYITTIRNPKDRLTHQSASKATFSLYSTVSGVIMG